MHNWVRFCVLVYISCFPLAAAKHKPAVPHPSFKKGASHRKLAVSRRATVSKKSGSRKRPVVAARTPARQAIPSSDRYREIQEALAAKGYLATPANGIWDQNAQDAMRKFQTDQNLSVSGKLTSRSIIALGLGSSSAAVPPSPSPSAVPPKP